MIMILPHCTDLTHGGVNGGRRRHKNVISIGEKTIDITLPHIQGVSVLFLHLKYFPACCRNESASVECGGAGRPARLLPPQL